MNGVTHLRQVVQVKTPRRLGYATVSMINADGSVRRREHPVVARFPSSARDAVTSGSVWEVSGNEVLTQFTVGDYLVYEHVIECKSVRYLRPSGRVLARWLAANIEGIGDVIANRLVRQKDLKSLVEGCDKEALRKIAGMTDARVERLIEHWPSDSLYDVIEWLEAQQLPLGLGQMLVKFFGDQALKKIRSQPFLLMSMGVTFKKTMAVAKSLGLSMDDEAVVAGVAQHVAVTHGARTGSTVIGGQVLLDGCARVMQAQPPANAGETAVKAGLLVKVDTGYQVYGTALMEAAVARCLMDAHTRFPGDDSLAAAWEKAITKQTVATALVDYELTLGFKLTDEQRAAVIGTVLSPVAVISGGAGTGKTTILRAVLGIYELVAPGLSTYQVALSGRAAQRMAESTGKSAQTIAKLVSDHTGRKRRRLPDHVLVIIDEASMVDLLSMFRLVGILPVATRILFVGDVAQLPPVGAGLVFHALEGTPIPSFNLTTVKRQSEQSGVYRFAQAIRESRLTLPPRAQETLAESVDCSIEPDVSMERFLPLWQEALTLGPSIVLSPIRKGPLGVNKLNAMLQSASGAERTPVSYLDPVKGWIPWVTPSGARLLKSDPVLVTANNYDMDADIRNGEIGIIDDVFDHPDADGAVGILALNGASIRMTSDVLEKLDLGYAVTIHKAQGSQWDTCFVMLPKEAARMVDQTLLYTASTRGSRMLLLIGDSRLVEQAVNKGPLALHRKTLLNQRIIKATFCHQQPNGHRERVS